MTDWKNKDKKYWQGQLSPEQYKVCRLKGTEKAFSGEHWDSKKQGVYLCSCCGLELFDSKTKYDSGTGWPSFYAPVVTENVAEEADNSLFRKRTEVLCDRCGCHLGHVFKDGPQPTGLRYCINSVSLKLKEESPDEK